MGEPERRPSRALREAFAVAKFRHQVPLGFCHADFCAHAARLIIEVDGNDHAAGTTHDSRRTAFLESQGYRVIRFANRDVIENLAGVIAAIDGAITQKGRP